MQVIDTSHIEEKWYCRRNVPSGQSGTNQLLGKLFLFPLLKLIGRQPVTQYTDVELRLKAAATITTSGLSATQHYHAGANHAGATTQCRREDFRGGPKTNQAATLSAAASG